jgi:hypothetical protein
VISRCWSQEEKGNGSFSGQYFISTRHRLSDHMHSTDVTVANFVSYISKLLTEYLLDVTNTITNIYEME